MENDLALTRSGSDPNLDLRASAVLRGTDPHGVPVVELPDELRDVLAAAVTGLAAELPARSAGIGVVLGSGVLTRLVQPSTEGDANALLATPSRIDRRG